jgi:hypothetical protein
MYVTLVTDVQKMGWNDDVYSRGRRPPFMCFLQELTKAAGIFYQLPKGSYWKLMEQGRR